MASQESDPPGAALPDPPAQIPDPPSSTAASSASTSSSTSSAAVIQPKNGSRESSEFEFVGAGAGAATPQKRPDPPPPPPPPASLPTSPSGGPSDLTTSAKLSAEGSSSPEPGLFGWVKGASGGILSKVAEKTKTSVESMITTLDPQMKDYIYSGGDIEIVVASDKDVKVSPVRDSFQTVFGRATVYGVPAFPAVSVATQPVGYAAGRQGALERIQTLKNKGTLTDQDAVVSIEGFLLEVGEDSWVELSCLLLSDPARNVTLTCYSQPCPVDARFIQIAKDATPESYPKRWSGLAETVGSVIGKAWSIPPQDWQEATCGVSRRESLALASKALAGMYQRALRKNEAHHPHD